jgi:hypothetical protein
MYKAEYLLIIKARIRGIINLNVKEIISIKTQRSMYNIIPEKNKISFITSPINCKTLIEIVKI